MPLAKRVLRKTLRTRHKRCDTLKYLRSGPHLESETVFRKLLNKIHNSELHRWHSAAPIPLETLPCPGVVLCIVGTGLSTGPGTRAGTTQVRGAFTLKSSLGIEALRDSNIFQSPTDVQSSEIWKLAPVWRTGHRCEFISIAERSGCGFSDQCHSESADGKILL